MLITRRHGSWVVLGTLVTDVELEPTPPLDARLRRVPALHRRVPDRRARRAGRARRDALPLVLDAGAGADPRGRTASALGAQVYGCDICQDVCPWNRGVEKRRAGEAPPRRRRAARLARRLARGRRRASSAARYDRLYVPRNDPRYLRRNALVALGNTGAATDAALAEPYAHGDDPLLREHAEWALARLEERGVNGELRAPARRSSAGSRGSASAPSRSRSSRSRSTQRLPAGYEAWAWVDDRRLRGRGARALLCSPRATWPRARSRRLGVRGARLRLRGRLRLRPRSSASSTATPIRQVLYLVADRGRAALRDRRRRSAVVVASAPVLVGLRVAARATTSSRARTGSTTSRFQLGLEVLIGLIVGWLVRRLRERERASPRTRAARGGAAARRARPARRRLEAANRCARALGSSLELDEAFGAFIRELRGLLPFDRTAIVLVEDGAARGDGDRRRGRDEVLPPGSRPAARTARCSRRCSHDQTVYRRDMSDQPTTRRRRSSSRSACAARSRRRCSLGARPIGMLSLVRERAGRLQRRTRSSSPRCSAGSSRPRCRTSAPTRPSGETVEELRRLSALRADFVSLVSHELRSPMAAVIGAARTLQERWRELTPEQRESFLALIADETNRLATLIGDVLDTSRIEAGTFSYRFSDVDLARARARRRRDRRARPGRGAGRRRACASRCRSSRRPRAAAAGADEPDRQRGQVLAGGRRGRGARLRARTAACASTSRDHGPGIPQDEQRLIFEKFGRADGRAAAKPGTGLGLFIARSIAEAHGGTLDVAVRARRRARPSRSTLPLDRPARRVTRAGGATPSSLRERLRARRRSARRSSGGSSTTPRRGSERISPTSHSALPTGCSRDRRAVREQARAALDRPAGDLPASRARARRARRGARAARSPRAARTARACSRRAAHPVEPERALAVARAVPRVDVPVRQLALERVRLDQVRRRLLLALLQVLDLDEPPLADAVG